MKLMKTYFFLMALFLGIGDWGLGIGDWANPQSSPIPNPQSPFSVKLKYIAEFNFLIAKIFYNLYYINNLSPYYTNHLVID